jgi:hypothetical protein
MAGGPKGLGHPYRNGLNDKPAAARRFYGWALWNASGIPEPTHKKTPGFRQGLVVRRDDWIRTSDPLHPMQVRYRAALHPERGCKYMSYLGFSVQMRAKFTSTSALFSMSWAKTYSCLP